MAAATPARERILAPESRGFANLGGAFQIESSAFYLKTEQSLQNEALGADVINLKQLQVGTRMQKPRSLQYKIP